MITKWTVSNFKSISKEKTLDLSPLTIFAGPNSSGKSTVLQSLLLICQTLSHKISSRSVVLNGALTRLGEFDDLRSFKSEFDQITIGWECRPKEEANMAMLDKISFPSRAMIYGRRTDLIKEITCKLSFDTNPGSAERELFQLQPKLFLFTMSVIARVDDNADQHFEMTVSRSPSNIIKDINPNYPINDIIRDSLEFDIVFDKHSLAEIREEFSSAEPIGCTLQHFLPERIFIKANLVEEIAKRIRKGLSNDFPRFRPTQFMERELVIPHNVVSQLREHLGGDFQILFEKQPSLFEMGDEIPMREWNNRLQKLSYQKRRDLRDKLNRWKGLQQIIENALRAERKGNESESQLIPNPFRLPVVLMESTAYTSTYFSNSVKYLGPLRDEPKALYPLAAHADPADVGLRGEMTAAVLYLHRERKIRYIPSKAFGKKPIELIPITRSLDAAVTDWLQYLGVAESAFSIDKGKLGHELKVTLAEGGPKHDLTHVGVGVSQVLPILVMSLLAEPDTTLIFEQPELHLHPKVQTRLADFFLSIVLNGKQCLIETHSEYLINRLRYRAAEEEKSSRVTDNLKIYFVEKTGDTSDFCEVKVNEYGAILEWPEGFFDQSPREAEDILRAAMKKRRSEKKDGIPN